VSNESEKPMKASVFTEFGGEMKLVDNIRAPLNPGANEVVVEVHATSINPVDWKYQKGYLKLFVSSHFPKSPGRDFSGVVSEVGINVSRFKVGDEVYGMPVFPIGTFCEYIKCSQDDLAKKPTTLTMNEAAGIPLAALTASDCLFEHGRLQEKQSVLVLGGATAVGQFTIQLAKVKGAHPIYTTCSPDSINLVKDLGADVTIDYKSQSISEVLGQEKVHLVVDAVGNKVQREQSFPHVIKNGIFVTVNPGDSQPFTIGNAFGVMADVLSKKVSNYWNNNVSYKTMLTKDHQWKVLDDIGQMVDQGKLKVLIDSVYQLSEAQQALEKNSQAKNKGKIIIQVKENAKN